MRYLPLLLFLALLWWSVVALVYGQRPASAPPAASPATPLSDKERSDYLILQSQLASLVLKQSQLASDRDKAVEAAIRQALESWYQTRGSDFGRITSQVDFLTKQLTDRLKDLQKHHKAEGKILDYNGDWVDAAK